MTETRAVLTELAGPVPWTFARVSGPDSRELLLECGVKAAVQVIEVIHGKRWNYEIWRLPEYTAFPLSFLIDALDDAECRAGGHCFWVGDGDQGWTTVSSSLSPESVRRVIEQAIVRSLMTD